MSHLLLSVMGAFAQFERDLIRERQREGITLAKLRKVPISDGSNSLIPPRQKSFVVASRRASRRRGSQASLESAARLYINTLREPGSEGNSPEGNALSVRERQSSRPWTVRYLLHAEAAG